MSRRVLWIGSVVAASAVGAAIVLTPRVLKREPRLEPPAHLSTTARALLAARMLRHGDQMNDLTYAVLRIDYAGVSQVASEIAAEPRLARPSVQDATELNASLPERFFVLQDELKSAADALDRAAQSHDANALAAGYGRLSAACVSCHDAYMHDAPVSK
jgi:hypothetical protein